MNKTWTDGLNAVTIDADSDELAVILYALQHIAAGHCPDTGGDNRLACRTAYEGLAPANAYTDEDYRSPSCTGGKWCRCPVPTPCTARGTSDITGFTPDAHGVQRLARLNNDSPIARAVRAHLTPDV